MDTAQYPLAEKYFKQFLSLVDAHPEQERDPTPALINLAQLALERKDEPAAQEWLAKVDSYDGKNEAWLSVQIRRAQLYAKPEKSNRHWIF